MNKRRSQLIAAGIAVLVVLGVVMIAFEPFAKEEAGSSGDGKTGNETPGITDVAQVHDALGGATGGGSQRKFVPGQVLVRFKSGTSQSSRSSVLDDVDASVKRKLPLPGLELVAIDKGASVNEAVAAFEGQPEVLYAEPNFIRHIQATPDDARFGELWGLHNTGQSVNGTSGTADADIDAPEAWNRTTGSSAIKVAVVDSGVAYDHPDLAPNIATSPAGYDFVDNDNDPRDLNGHGTHVAGTIGARGNNGQGVAGVNWQVGLIPVRVCDADGSCPTDSIISGFAYAAANGAKVVNASFGGPSSSQAESDTIANSPDTLFVVAAGNEGTNNDTSPRYPCNYPRANIVCVAATTQDDSLAGFSNYGANSVDLGAPGENVLSTQPAYAPVFGDGFENDISGTWTTGGTNNTWARTNEAAQSGSFSLTDSPGANYLNNTDSFARNTSAMNFSGRQGCQVGYELKLDTELGYDALFVEANTNTDPSTFTTLSGLSGSTQGNFYYLSTDLSAFDGAGTVFVRFDLYSDVTITKDGAHIDSVVFRCLSSSFNGTELQFLDGTSMATPQVAGAVALLWSQAPSLSPAEIKSALLSNVDPLSSLTGKTVSGGRLNADIDLNPSASSLDVSLNGSGTGTVTGPGINCPGDCTESYASGASVTLNAEGTGASTFGGWGGACSGTGSCDLTMDADKSVSASFTGPPANLTVTLPGTGTGTVTGPGINCPGDCTQTYDRGSSVTLSAAASGGSSFGGWGGACGGTGNCQLTMDADKNALATFLPPPLPPPPPPGAQPGPGTGPVVAKKCKKGFKLKKGKCVRKKKKKK